jgi:hypothetical protein
MAGLRLITILLTLGVTPAFADCIIIYANDMGPKVTREIRNHELAHCNGWEHPHGYDKARGFEKAYIPPKRFLRPISGKLYEHPMSTRDAKASCDGMLGCSDILAD